MWQAFISFLESNMYKCVYVKYLGIECPGCGMQRAFVQLLKGNVIESIFVYPALLPLLFTLLFLPLHLFFKFGKGAVILKFSFIFTTLIMAISYIAKQLF